MEELTVAEAAAILELSPVAVRKRIERGAMKARLLTPRLYLIPRREVEKWLAVGKLKRGPKPAKGKRQKLARESE